MTRASTIGFCSLALALFGCAEPPEPSVAKPQPVVTASAVAVEPAPTASATAVVAAEPALTPPPRTRVDMTAALSRLPKNAAAYGLFRPAAGDTLIEWAKNPEGARREFRRLVPSGTFLEIVTTLGVDPAVPVAFAVVGPDLPESQKLIDKLIGASKTNPKADPVQVALDAAPANGTLIRFVLRPSAAERDTLAELERFSEKARLRFVRCPDAPLCAKFTGDKPIGIIDRSSTTIAFYKQPGMLEVDWMESRIGDGESRAKLLSSKRALTGGPAGNCSKLDSESDLSFCIDGTRAGDLGAATGLGKVATAVQGVSFDQRSKILQQGKKEALTNLTLANPKRKLADDGTLSISIAKNGYTATASWLLTEASMGSVQTNLARETCSASKNLAADLIPALQKAFGDPGSDFKDLKQRQDDFRDAGFGSVLVAFARIWPNMLGAVKEGPNLGVLSFNRVCARANADRLELRVDGPPLDVDRL